MDNYICLRDKSYLKRKPIGMYFSAVNNDVRVEVGLNESAESIISCLTGEMRIHDIVVKLAEKFNDSHEKVDKIVREFIDVLDVSNQLEYFSSPIFRKVLVKGSEEYYVPEVAVLELTHNCPLKCKHCYLDAGIGPSMDRLKLLELINTFSEYGVQCIQLTGGEPFLYPFIEEIIDLLILENIKIQITTSGFIFNEKVSRILDKISNRGSLVQISIDGLENSHNKIRGNDKAYEKALYFLNECSLRKITTVAATCVVSQEFEEIELLTIKLKKMGVSLHRIGRISDQGRAKSNNISSQMSGDLLNNLIDTLKNKYNDDSYRIGGFEDIDCEKEYNCGAGYNLINISPTFKISPCPMMNICIGNLAEEDFESVIRRNSSVFVNLRRPFDDICKGCEREYDCKNCIAEAYTNKDGVNHCGWYNDEFKSVEKEFSSSFNN